MVAYHEAGHALVRLYVRGARAPGPSPPPPMPAGWAHAGRKDPPMLVGHPTTSLADQFRLLQCVCRCPMAPSPRLRRVGGLCPNVGQKSVTFRRFVLCGRGGVVAAKVVHPKGMCGLLTAPQIAGGGWGCVSPVLPQCSTFPR